MASRKEQKERARQQRLGAERAAAARAAKARRLRLAGVGGAAVIAAAVIAVVSATSGSGGGRHPSVPAAELGPLSTLGPLESPGNAGPTGPEGVPAPRATALAPAGAPAPQQSVDGITCQSEQTLFHVHTHLTIFVDGSPRQVPDGVGIVPPRQVQETPDGPFAAGGTCLTWLHTHASDGIIHIESPVQRTFTLGNFFDIWGQPLAPGQVGPARGHVTAFYNGRHYLGNPRNIPIGDHAQIQLDVGSPLIAPGQTAFPSGL